MSDIRTDLAIEAAALFNKSDDDIGKLDGVEVIKESSETVNVTHVKITNANGEKTIGKKIGNYITIESPKIRENDYENFKLTAKILSENLKKLLSQSKCSTVLAVGLGNWNVTPDALGPKVIGNLAVTRHFAELDELDDGANALCAISPGVLGITGIETSEIIKGITEMIKPDVIIAIDALASRKTERISTTIQLADTGITPGSGIGNKRKGLDFDYLGVPVIAIGVPTVVDAATIANDSIELFFQSIPKNSRIAEKISDYADESIRYALIKELLTPYVGDLIVTPKEVDGIIAEVSKIIASGINQAVVGCDSLEKADMQ